ncbi:P1 family peptidase [Robiginitomaculum antarcticum]|uniref:P1 family peptidase n=1 Tax=Robiginitomaculum antarcticum TaxID=437507 RepID=UPI001F2176AF|nr:P1 family peptidase [Robiginitomaculum antarcticum]
MMIKTGPTNSILDAGGLTVGQAHDSLVKSGVTVILPEAAAICSVDVRGGGPGTREIMALCDGGLIEHVHAIVLAGGSVYGLAAADGVTAWLGAQGLGYVAGKAPVPVSPVVPSAVLFDNANGGDKAWGMTPPFRRLGIEACDGAAVRLLEGRIGAGYGAMAGLYPGGLGSASEKLGNITVGAIIAANPVGSPFMPGTDCPYAWTYEVDGEFGGKRPPENYALSVAQDTKLSSLKLAGQSTVIGAVAVNAALTQKQLKRLAIMAQDGVAMAVRPAHTPLDGDTIFALSTGNAPCAGPVHLAELGAAAARCVARALTRGVIKAVV